MKVDVGDVVDYSEKTHTSFFANFLYLVSKVNNGRLPLRLRYVDGEALEYDVIDPTFTVKTAEGSFNNATFEYTPDYPTFHKRCVEEIERNNQRVFYPDSYNEPRYDRFYSSCLTTISIEGMTQPLNYDDKNSLNVPRVFYDRYREENGRLVMLVSFTVSHILMDGEHNRKRSIS